MERYEKYKDSGIEWIGDIPEHWDIKRLKYIGDSIIGMTYSPKEIVQKEGTLVLRSSNIQKGKLSLKDTVYINKDVPEKLVIRKGDILICSRNGSRRLIGKNITIDKRTEGETFGAFMTVFRTEQYKFISQYFNSQVFSGQSGLFLTATINQLTINTLNNFYTALPPKQEQTKIANYLDKKNTEIDELITQKETLLNLYEEEKTAIINQAVTKGINPKVKLKDSGIDWLGEIPVHWEVTRINRIIKVKDGTHDTPKYINEAENSFPLVTSKDFKNGKIDFTNTKHISEQDHLNIYKRSNAEKGDIIMSMIGGNIGNLVLINTTRQFSIKNVALFKTSKNKLQAKHLYYILKSNLIKIQIDLNSRGGAQGFLSLYDLRSLIYFIVPFKELETIIDFLDTKMEEINYKVAKTKKLIILLKEYKTALISEVVTGKIKVN